MATSHLMTGKHRRAVLAGGSVFFLLGLSKGNARVEISASFFFFFFFVQPQFAIL